MDSNRIEEETLKEMELEQPNDLQDTLHDLEQQMQQEEVTAEEDNAQKQPPPPHAGTPPLPNPLSTSRSMNSGNNTLLSNSPQGPAGEDDVLSSPAKDQKEIDSKEVLPSAVEPMILESKKESEGNQQEGEAPNPTSNVNVVITEPEGNITKLGESNKQSRGLRQEGKGPQGVTKTSVKMSMGNTNNSSSGKSSSNNNRVNRNVMPREEEHEEYDEEPPTEEELQALAEELADSGEVPVEFQRLRKSQHRPCRHEETPGGLYLNNNSHDNRMEKGSYSRFLMSQDYVDPSTTDRERTFTGERNFFGTVPINVDYKQTIHEKMNMTEEELAEEEEGWSASSRGLPHRKRYSLHDQDGTRLLSRSAQETQGWGLQSKGQSLFLLSATGSRMEGGDDGPVKELSHPHHSFGASTMKREAELLDDELYQELCRQRERRKRVPHHCKPVRKERDYVYYNHKSKGFYVPQDPQPTAKILTYNHLYDFGDGTRMGAANNNSTKRDVPEVLPDGTVREYNQSRRNPTAQAPLAYHETTRGAAAYNETFWDTTHRRNQKLAHSATSGGATLNATRTNKKREDINKQSSSLHTAKALQVKDIHISQAKNQRAIEDIVAQNSHLLKADSGEAPRYTKFIQKGAEPHPAGTTHPTSSSAEDAGLYGASKEGKIKWDEIPPHLRNAVEEALDRKQNRAMLRESANRGGERPSTSESLPSIAGRQRGEEAPAYKVSRLNYKKEYHKDENPSAFVR